MGRRGGPSCARAMARLAAVRSHYCALLLAAALAVCAFYYLGSGRETFSSATKRLKEARAGAPAAPSPPAPEAVRGSAVPAAAAKAKGLEGGGPGPVDYHLLMMFTKAEHSAALQAKARVALRSLLRLAKFEPHEVLNLHFVSEEASREVAKALLRELLPPAAGFKCKVVFHDVGVLTDKLFPVVEAMQKHFSAGSGTYYSDSIFFLSVAMHQIMPKEILRIIQLDLDLKYKTNIRELFEEFDSFLPGAVIGIAREMQPVYRLGATVISGGTALSWPFLFLFVGELDHRTGFHSHPQHCSGRNALVRLYSCPALITGWLLVHTDSHWIEGPHYPHWFNDIL
ncbi:xyloside xylosyltransferase 1 isoform X6 [Vulpes lagopus]|uniref:xyloside xylosyltransferase 1 isoform X6 n=1 Tax=Vulpes lagopus TaxID=494514 RepID=UPI001BC93488|nr:xyloside xylosyltransferase 1 isoform X6 [Vulpes lagopus]